MTSREPATAEQIATAPEVTLHEHLDGGVGPEAGVGSARESGQRLRTQDPGELERWFVESAGSGSLERYLETFSHAVAVMQRADVVTRVAAEAVVDLARDSVVYAELRWAPEQHLGGGLSLREAVEAVQAGIDLGRAQAGNEGYQITVGQLLTAMRHADWGVKLAEMVVEYRERGVDGIDIGGGERGLPHRLTP